MRHLAQARNPLHHLLRGSIDSGLALRAPSGAQLRTGE